MRYLITLIAFLIYAFAYAESANAQPSKTDDTTPTNRFRQFEGTWIIADNSTTSLGGLTLIISEPVEGDGRSRGEFVLVSNDDFILVDLAPVKASLRRSELTGDYTTRDRDAGLKSLLGSSGEFVFSISAVTDGTTFTGTFFPEQAPQVSFAAERVGKHPMSSKIVNKISVKGKRKPGGTITVTAKFINRGPGTLVRSAGKFATVGVEGDIASAQVVATKGLIDECEQTTETEFATFFAECPVQYIGPPKKSTFASLTYRLTLADSARSAVERARPVVSHFSVGAALEFSNGQIVTGGNYEDLNTTTGACAERAALFKANAEFGPLGHRRADEGPIVVRTAVFTPTDSYSWPCGICRSALDGASLPSMEVVSACNQIGVQVKTMRDLYPIAGRGPGGDALMEVERMVREGVGVVWHDTLPAALKSLTSTARREAEKSYIPPFASDSVAPAGAVLEYSDGHTTTGFVSIEATTRLGGRPIANAVRSNLVGNGPVNPLVRVLLFTESEALIAPDGVDLQLLQEIGNSGTQVLFGCLRGMAQTTLMQLLPFAFGRSDLGY